MGVPPTTPIDRQILQHLLSRQYSEGLDLARRNAKKVAQSPISRHNVAIIKGIAGDRAGAIQDLRDIVAAGIGPGQSILCLGSLFLDEDRPVDAIEAARTFRAFLPKDPAGPLLEGEALRTLGRLDEAWNAAEEAERLEPGDARTTVLKGRIVIARGDVEDAQHLLHDAERLAPGDFLLLVARFELAKEQGDEAAAQSLLTRIQEYVAAMPVSLYQKRLERMGPCERVEAVSPTLAPSEVLQLEE
jgi:tetratricopeptide (TPR) repeat protein